MPQILIVDHGVDDLPVVSGDLSSSWYRLVAASSVEAAIPQAIACGDLLAAVVADDLPAVSFAEMERRLHGALPGLPLLALTRDVSVGTVVDLMRSGAVDVLVRPLMEVSLVRAVSRLFMGRSVAPVAELANRERQVFTLLGEGCSTSEIAERLQLSIKTIDGTLIRLRAKMGCPEVSSLRRLAVSRARQQAVEQALVTVIPVMGYAPVDAGHHGMLTQLCRIEQALGGTDEDPAFLIQAADALVASAHEHDQIEVGLMRASGFPGMVEHQAAHAELLEEILALKARVTEGRSAGAAAFRSFALHWLGQHVQRFDRVLVAHVRRHLPEGRG